MIQFRIGKRTVNAELITGRVLSTDKYGETHVTGGGYGRHAPAVSSYVLTKHEFWIAGTDGIERSFQFSGLNIPLRVDQRISILALGDGDHTRLAAMINHDAQKRYEIVPIPELATSLGIGKSIFWACLEATLILALVVALFFVRVEVGVVGIVGASIYLCLRTTRKATRKERALKSAIDNIVDDALRSG